MHVYISLCPQPLPLVDFLSAGVFRVRHSLSLFTLTYLWVTFAFEKHFLLSIQITTLITMKPCCFSLFHLLISTLPLIAAATPILPPRASTTPSPALSFRPVSPPILINPNAVYPRATTLFNLSSPTPDKPLILASYTTTTTTRSNGQKSLSASVTSADNAQTWTFLSHIWTANATTHDIDNPFPLQLPNGHVLYSFRNHDIDPRTGRYTYYRITVCLSTDFGSSWEFLSHAAERRAAAGEDDDNNGLWEPFMRVDNRGRVQVYYSSERGRTRQDNIVRVSGDGGRTWGGEVVVSRGEESRDGMMGVAEVVVPGGGEGRLICIFETTEDGGRFAVDTVESVDDGRSWGEGTRRRVYTARSGKDAGAPQVVSVGGVLVGSFMTNEGGSEGGGEGVDGGEMKIVLSRDGGKSWERAGDGKGEGEMAAVAAAKGSHWPGLFKLDDRRFLGLYSADGVGAVSRVFEISG
ncbi:family 93 putative glycoside hydrolase [Cercophora samala]|uniref:Family 93 putative glycoside hydrolase n=1 Tax=Cercophora samala TaxID=330535 RepID=A0AA39ZF40_9PEZI|nr:family 93 putative glycoside hydrolase [Cercophora samala]